MKKKTKSPASKKIIVPNWALLAANVLAFACAVGAVLVMNYLDLKNAQVVLVEPLKEEVRTLVIFKESLTEDKISETCKEFKKEDILTCLRKKSEALGSSRVSPFTWNTLLLGAGVSAILRDSNSNKAISVPYADLTGAMNVLEWAIYIGKRSLHERQKGFSLRLINYVDRFSQKNFFEKLILTLDSSFTKLDKDPRLNLPTPDTKSLRERFTVIRSELEKLRPEMKQASQLAWYEKVAEKGFEWFVSHANMEGSEEHAQIDQR